MLKTWVSPTSPYSWHIIWRQVNFKLKIFKESSLKLAFSSWSCVAKTKVSRKKPRPYRALTICNGKGHPKRYLCLSLMDHLVPCSNTERETTCEYRPSTKYPTSWDSLAETGHSTRFRVFCGELWRIWRGLGLDRFNSELFELLDFDADSKILPALGTRIASEFRGIYAFFSSSWLHFWNARPLQSMFHLMEVVFERYLSFKFILKGLLWDMKENWRAHKRTRIFKSRDQFAQEQRNRAVEKKTLVPIYKNETERGKAFWFRFSKNVSWIWVLRENQWLKTLNDKFMTDKWAFVEVN